MEKLLGEREVAEVDVQLQEPADPPCLLVSAYPLAGCDFVEMVECSLGLRVPTSFELERREVRERSSAVCLVFAGGCTHGERLVVQPPRRLRATALVMEDREVVERLGDERVVRRQQRTRERQRLLQQR